MPKTHETRTLPYTQEQLFDLVADVARYREFLPWVQAVRVRSDSETEMVADLVVGFKGIHENFTSRVTKLRPEKIRVEYLEGPLKYLYNDWTFRPDGQSGEGRGCIIDFTVDFAFRSRVFEALAGQVFDRALRKMIGAFEQRAAALYGPVESGISRSSAKSAA
ncbi:type II toxin-antitoxin system RatA family toxin [Sphingomonas profundi]|uniref:type II toxin-antitoxin system RatA family toxin n=1 Tax=Alterirhizorhabdus profundi TaxID=2681549 RepID=UPI0012E91D62|nr:type II toxin-antitoxin system RatA family toxin [Sphingomonas profundi]